MDRSLMLEAAALARGTRKIELSTPARELSRPIIAIG